MNFEKFKNLKHFAEILNITTAQELLSFKKENQVSTNDELYLALYHSALFKIKNAS